MMMYASETLDDYAFISVLFKSLLFHIMMIRGWLDKIRVTGAANTSLVRIGVKSPKGSESVIKDVKSFVYNVWLGTVGYNWQVGFSDLSIGSGLMSVDVQKTFQTVAQEDYSIRWGERSVLLFDQRPSWSGTQVGSVCAMRGLMVHRIVRCQHHSGVWLQ